jgi:hypothetical protein
LNPPPSYIQQTINGDRPAHYFFAVLFALLFFAAEAASELEDPGPAAAGLLGYEASSGWTLTRIDA